MSIFDAIQNPFAAASGAISGHVAAGRKRDREASERAGRLREVDWLDQQSHGRSMEFMRAQHGNTLELEKFRGGETRKNMAAAQKQGLSEFSNQMLADGSHSTSFKIDRSQPLGAAPANPLVGASIQPVGAPSPVAAPGSASGAQSSDQKASTAPQAAQKPKKDLAPPAHSGGAFKAKGTRQAMLPGTKP